MTPWCIQAVAEGTYYHPLMAGWCINKKEKQIFVSPVLTNRLIAEETAHIEITQLCILMLQKQLPVDSLNMVD